MGQRYGHCIEESRLPKQEADRPALAEQIGADGKQLLAQAEYVHTRVRAIHERLSEIGVTLREAR